MCGQSAEWIEFEKGQQMWLGKQEYFLVGLQEQVQIFLGAFYQSVVLDKLTFGLDLEGSCRTFTCFLFGCNQEGLIDQYIACNQLYIYELRIVIWYQIWHYFFLFLCFTTWLYRTTSKTSLAFLFFAFPRQSSDVPLFHLSVLPLLLQLHFLIFIVIHLLLIFLGFGGIRG